MRCCTSNIRHRRCIYLRLEGKHVPVAAADDEGPSSRNHADALARRERDRGRRGVKDAVGAGFKSQYSIGKTKRVIYTTSRMAMFLALPVYRGRLYVGLAMVPQDSMGRAIASHVIPRDSL